MTKQAQTANSTKTANNDGIIANSGDEDEQLNETTDGASSNNVQISTSAANTAAMKAKKRRIGGVNIFPGMRKVRSFLFIYNIFYMKLIFSIVRY